MRRGQIEVFSREGAFLDQTVEFLREHILISVNNLYEYIRQDLNELQHQKIRIVT